MTQRGADVVKRDAGHGLRRPRAIRKIRAHWRAAGSDGRPNESWSGKIGKRKSTTSNQRASQNYQACLPDISLQFKQSLPNTPKLQIHREIGPAAKRLLPATWGNARLQRSDFSSEFLVTSMRATRLQLRCNPDSRVGGAYTSSPSNLQFGEADGDAPV